MKGGGGGGGEILGFLSTKERPAGNRDGGEHSTREERKGLARSRSKAQTAEDDKTGPRDQDQEVRERTALSAGAP